MLTAITLGPLMSLDASGSVAGTITFSKWKGRNYVRQLVTPANPRSALQVSTRAIMRFLSQEWTPNLSTAEKATWDALASSDAVSPFNAYTRENLRRWTQFTAPGKSSPVGETGTQPTFTSPPASTGGVRQVTIAWTPDVLNDAWGLLIFRDPVTAFATARDNLVGAAFTDSAGAKTFIDTPVEPGTYFYNYRTFTDDGALSSEIGETTATVT